MNALLQNSASNKQTPAEPTYTYVFTENENESLQQMFFRLFEQVSTENTDTSS